MVTDRVCSGARSVDETKRLPSDARAVREVRRFVHQTLSGAGVSAETVENAVLLASEVFTNVVLHASTPADVRTSLDGKRVRIEVTDGSPQLPELRVFDFVSASGRGLAILAELAAAWGVDPLPSQGKRVWFELPA